MIHLESDSEDVVQARSAYNAYKTESTIIAWICSEEWTMVGYVPRIRGEVKRSGARRAFEYHTEIAGEIENAQ